MESLSKVDEPFPTPPPYLSPGKFLLQTVCFTHYFPLYKEISCIFFTPRWQSGWERCENIPCLLTFPSSTTSFLLIFSWIWLLHTKQHPCTRYVLTSHLSFFFKYAQWTCIINFFNPRIKCMFSVKAISVSIAEFPVD